MNWGHKIIMVYVVFVAGMSLLAYKSSKQNIELVTEDYYAKELVYQQKIDAVKRTSLLSDTVIIKVNQHELIIQFPNDFTTQKLTGNASLYCPSDETKDKQQPFTITNQMVHFSIPDNYHGLHYLKVNWTAAGVHYYYEKKIII